MYKFLVALFVPFFVQAALLEIKSPADGFVETLFVKEGEQVSKGDPLVQLIDPTASLKVVELQSQIAKLEEELNNFRCSIESEECHFVEAILQKMKALVQKRQLTSDDLQALVDDEARKVTLLKEGLVNQDALQSAKEAVVEKKEQLAQIEEQILDIEDELVQGHQFEAVQKIVTQIKQAESDLRATNQLLGKLLLLAPEEGTISQILHLAGERITAQEPLLRLSTADPARR